MAKPMKTIILFKLLKYLKSLYDFREKGVPEQMIKKITGKVIEGFKGEKFSK